MRLPPGGWAALLPAVSALLIGVPGKTGGFPSANAVAVLAPAAVEGRALTGWNPLLRVATIPVLVSLLGPLRLRARLVSTPATAGARCLRLLRKRHRRRMAGTGRGGTGRWGSRSFL